jgi:hypothetical protein
MVGERVRSFWTRPQNTAVRDERGMQRDITREGALEGRLAEAEMKHDATRVGKIMTEISKLDRRRAYRLFDALVQVRLIIARQLRLLEDIKTTIDRDQELSAEQRSEVDRKLEEDRNRIEGLLNEMFERETSFTSINVTAKKLLGVASQARESYFEFIKARRTTGRTNRDERRLARDARGVTKKNLDLFERHIVLFDKHLEEELAWLRKASADTILLLQDDVADITAKETRIKQLMAVSGFPKPIGQEILASYDATLLDTHRRLLEEIAKKRIEISAAKRAA